MSVTSAQPTAATAPVARTRGASRANWRKTGSRVVVTLLATVLLIAFLAPMASMVINSITTVAQMAEPGAPILPSEPATVEIDGETLDMYLVPLPDGTTQNLAMVKPGRRQSVFINPEDLAAGEIVWEGNWRSLERDWTFAPTWENYPEAWNTINFPLLFRNTLAIAVLGIIGTLFSCILVAYGFSRFRFPGRDILFTILISTIFLPAAVTIVPTFAFFSLIGWVGTWLPLIVPHFFANAYNVFLLRQYFMTLPREIDEAAMIDGANPVRILTSVILPMSTPVIVAVSLFHLVFAWNDFFAPLIYLSSRMDLQPIAVGLNRFSGIYSQNPPLVQAAALMASLLPILLFFAAQKVFIQGVVVTGVDK
jgi:multiple sugar transport system permease protein